MRRLSVLLLLLASAAGILAQDVRLPGDENALRFAIIGDSGTGGDEQLEIAKQLVTFHPKFPFEFAIMLGDNLYGKERARDYENKFEKPYKPLLDKGVKFYAALGNHDEPNQRFYKLFNMNGERYYSFKPKDGIRFFALDSNVFDQKQHDWLEKELAASGSDWKICFFHHPPYSSGERHGSNMMLREQLEPLFVKYGVSVVFTGHEHFYERIKPQKGITYFIAGSSAKLRRGGLDESPLTAKGFDQGYTFMLAAIVGDTMHFQTITQRGETIDSGTIRRVEPAQAVPTGTTGASKKETR
jgi:predicted phosphodiesterase